MIVRPGLVYPSGKPATRPDYDCEVGSLLTRESIKLLKSIGLNALSIFLKSSRNCDEKGVYKPSKLRYNTHIILKIRS